METSSEVNSKIPFFVLFDLPSVTSHPATSQTSGPGGRHC